MMSTQFSSEPIDWKQCNINMLNGEYLREFYEEFYAYCKQKKYIITETNKEFAFAYYKKCLLNYLHPKDILEYIKSYHFWNTLNTGDTYDNKVFLMDINILIMNNEEKPVDENDLLEYINIGKNKYDGQLLEMINSRADHRRDYIFTPFFVATFGIHFKNVCYDHDRINYGQIVHIRSLLGDNISRLFEKDFTDHLRNVVIGIWMEFGEARLWELMIKLKKNIYK